MARSNSKRISATAITVATSSVGFSAFLMDEVPDFNARSQKNGAKPPATSAGVYNSGVPIAVPNHLPALSAHKPTATATSAAMSATPVVTVAGGGGQREKDDIPVLEATKYGAFHSDEDDDDDDDDDDIIVVNGEDDDSEDDDNGETAGRDTFNEDVPVLQTLEDAQAFGDRQRSLGSKKFSWRESRHVTKRRKSRATASRVPDPETLLRMSSQTEFSSYSSSSGSLISGKESTVTVERQIVCKGWLYKQADILYVCCSMLLVFLLDDARGFADCN